MSFVVTAYFHKRDKTYNGTGSSQRMLHEIYPDEPRARQRAQDLVEVHGYQWATYERRERDDD